MKKIIFISAILFSGIVFSQTATTTVNIGSTVMPNPKLLLGITYDCRSSLSDPVSGLTGYHNTNGTFITAIDAIFNDFPMSTLRYPANGIMQGFEWKKSIGPVSTRPPQQIFASPSNPAQVMEFGFDEFMAMAASRGVAPKDVQIMVPIYDSADVSLNATQIKASIPNVVNSNADWVEYANAPNDGSNPGGGTDWAAIRAANGHPLPYGIKIWNMGNEPYTSNEFGSNGVNNYISMIIPAINSMLAIDATIKITVTVPGKVKLWTTTILNSTLLKGKIYGVNAHYFLSEEVINSTIPYGVDTIETDLLALAAAAQLKGYKLIVGDYAHAVMGGANPTQADQDIAMQWQGANLMTDFLLTMSQINNIERSDFWVYGLTAAQWHPIRKNSDGSYTLMPAAALYKKLSPLFLDNSISVSNVSPVASDGNSYSVRSGAFTSTNLSQLNVVAVNRDKNNTIPLKVNGITGYTLTNSRILTATSLNADVFSESAITADGSGNYPMPPMSVLILEYSQIVQGINQIDNSKDEFTIYPNPSNNFLNVVLSKNSFPINKIIIYDVTGKEIKSLDIKGNSKNLQADVSSLPKGIYLLILESGKTKYSKTFIIE